MILGRTMCSFTYLSTTNFAEAKDLRKIAILMLLLLGMAPLAHAQQGISIGAMLQVDNDRLEVATGVSFAMAAYTQQPPVEGLDSSDLIGLFTSSIGQYPVIYRGLWLKLIVYPGGFKNLQGVDFDDSGHLARDAKGWEQLTAELGGGYSLVWRADRIGALPLRFRIRHRDGKDRFTLLIFTASWTRGGNLPVALEVMIQRRPTFDLRGEEALPYLRGFIPATARSDGQVTQQKVEVPSQTATQTLPKAVEPPKVKDKETKPSKPEKPKVESPKREDTREPEIEYATVEVGAYQTSTLDKLDLLRERLLSLETQLLEDARRSSLERSVTEIQLSPRRHQTVLVMRDTRPFTAEVVLDSKTTALKVTRVNGRYEAVTWGKSQSFIDKSVLLVITDDDGRTRTITFAKEAK